MKKNILVLSYEYPLPWDGLASGIYELVTNIAKLNKDSSTRVFAGSVGTAIENPELNIKVRKGPRARKYISLYLTTSLFAYFYYLGKKIKGEVDIVHGHNHITFWFNIHKLLFGFIDKTPYILTLHSTASGRKAQIDEKLPFFTQYFEWPLHQLSDKLGCKVANKVICTTQNVLDEAVKYYGLNENKAEVITDGVNTSSFNENVTDNRKARHLQDKNILLFYGTISTRNQTEKLLNAFTKASIENKFLYLIGNGDEQYIQNLRNLLTTLNITQNVVIISDTNYSKLSPYFASANLFVYNSVYEGSIQSILQSLASNKTTIVSGFKSTDEKLNQNLIKIDRDITEKDLANMLESSILNTKQIDTQYIKANYNWKNIAEKYISQYQQITGEV